MATGARPSTPTTRPLHTERAQPRQFVGVPSGGTLRVSHGVVRIESGAKALLLSRSKVCGTTERKRLHQKARALRPVTLTPLTSLASLCAPKETTPPLAHRSTSSRACMIEIERRRTSAARALGALALSRSPNPHPPTHHLTFACARPLSRQVFSTPPLARPTHPRASQHGAAQRTRSAFVRARVRAVRSSGLLFFFERRRRPRARDCTSSKPPVSRWLRVRLPCSGRVRSFNAHTDGPRAATLRSSFATASTARCSPRSPRL